MKRKLYFLAMIAALAIYSCGQVPGPGSGTSDTTPPEVIGITPADGSTGVALNSIVTVTFSEDMDPTTITGDNIILSNGTNKIEGTIAYSNKTATFTPSNPLSTGTTYTVSVTTGVKDTAGNMMASAYTSTFATENLSPAPGNVNALAENGQVNISWDSVAGADHYNIYWSTSTGVTTSNGNQIPNAVSPYLQTGLTNGTTYYYVVTAVNSVGESAVSAEVSATPSFSPPPPPEFSIQ